jgi:hypothetical protein
MIMVMVMVIYGDGVVNDDGNTIDDDRDARVVRRRDGQRRGAWGGCVCL